VLYQGFSLLSIFYNANIESSFWFHPRLYSRGMYQDGVNKMINEISASELLELQAQEAPVRLVDVRTAAEVAQAALPNAEHMVMHTIPLKINDFERDQPIVFYCRTGARSAQVCHFLKQQGMDNVINLRGGIMDWVRQGHEAVSGEYMLAEAS